MFDAELLARVIVRWVMVFTGAVATVLAYGFFVQAGWATQLWPWSDGRMTFIFIASIAAAIALPNFWIAASGKLWAIGPGALNLSVSHLAMAGYLFALSGGDDRIVLAAAAMALAGVTELIAFLWSLRQPVLDARPTPLPLRLSFLLFAIALVVTGLFLVTKAAHIFPWPLKPQTSVIIGWIFWGAAVYFAAAFIWPIWENACGQLLGFLAYDLVLIVPYVAHLNKVKPQHALSLKVYIGVLACSGLLAVYYLFVHPKTRFRWKVKDRGSAERATLPA